MNIVKDTALALTLTTERIVQLINGDNTDGAAAKIAGAVAFDLALSDGYLDEEVFSGGLKYLKDKGAKFDFNEALKIAITWSSDWTLAVEEIGKGGSIRQYPKFLMSDPQSIK